MSTSERRSTFVQRKTCRNFQLISPNVNTKLFELRQPRDRAACIAATSEAFIKETSFFALLALVLHPFPNVSSSEISNQAPPTCFEQHFLLPFSDSIAAGTTGLYDCSWFVCLAHMHRLFLFITSYGCLVPGFLCYKCNEINQSTDIPVKC